MFCKLKCPFIKGTSEFRKHKQKQWSCRLMTPPCMHRHWYASRQYVSCHIHYSAVITASFDIISIFNILVFLWYKDVSRVSSLQCLQALKSVWAPATIPLTCWRLSCRTSPSGWLRATREVWPGGKQHVRDATSSGCFESIPSRLANLFVCRDVGAAVQDLPHAESHFSRRTRWAHRNAGHQTPREQSIDLWASPQSIHVSLYKSSDIISLLSNFGLSCWHNLKIMRKLWLSV